MTVSAVVVALLASAVAFDYYYTPAYKVPQTVTRTLEDNSTIQAVVNPELRMRAQKFRDALDAASKRPNSAPELNELLAVYIPIGSSFESAEELLSAAGFNVYWTSNVPPAFNTRSNLQATIRARHLRHASTEITLYPERNGEFTVVHEAKIKPFVLLW
ncbi:MAG: hypothetical protein EOO27_06190 [Comamonadaceae bacterium]|nr:MAG: hypothetical protein EOO27_06190 [Comamonadaceae bacterium]